ncbi:MAG TPA: alkaline phosphatase family protein [Anaerohalosphaeraceae bacterium]|nr:alkaline phosphatase family protein [Anaerohalosphaeraceae bacterium]
MPVKAEHSKTKMLIIGIDGGTWTILEPAICAGAAPNLKTLREKGVWGILKSTIPAITPAAWGAFQTGKNPGAIGVYDFYRWSAKERKDYPVNSTCLGKTIWQRFSQAGLTCGILNVPMTYPPQPVRGVVVSGLLTPSLESDFTYPAEFKEELLRAVPDYDILTFKRLQKQKITKRTIRDFVNQMAQSVRMRTRAAEYIIHTKKPDVMMVQFQSNDVIQHGLWHFLDPACPEYSEGLRNFVFDVFYRTLDFSIAEIVRTFYPDGNLSGGVFLLSDHGFARHRTRFNLGNWLVREGLLKIRSARLLKVEVSEFAETVHLGKILSYLLPSVWHQKVMRKFYPQYIQVDWEHSRAFATGRCNEGFIHIMEEDPEKKDSICRKIIDVLLKQRDPSTFEPIIEQVYRKEEIFKGAYLGQMPDLVVCPCTGYSITGAYQFEKGLFEPVRMKTDFHLGKHHRDGFYMAAGEGIQCLGSSQASLLDMAPTLLAYLGLPVPSCMDGQVRREWFAPSFWEENPIRWEQDESEEQKTSEDIYTSQEAEKVKKRLEELGYL